MRSIIPITRRILLFIALLLVVLPANGQNFQIVNDVSMIIHTSDDGRVMVGYDNNSGTHVIMVGGEIIPFPYRGDVYRDNKIFVSGDGSSVVGFDKSKGELFHYDIEKKLMKHLHYPPRYISAWEISISSIMVSATGDTVLASVVYQEDPTSDRVYHLIRWIDGISGTVKMFTRFTDYNSTWDVTSDMNTVVGSGRLSQMYTFDLSTNATVPLGVQGGRDVYITPEGNVIVGQSGALGNPSTYQPFRWEDGVTTLLGYADQAVTYNPLAGTKAVSISRDGSVMLGREDYRDEGNKPFIYSTIWTEPEGMRKLTDVFQNDLGFDLSGLDLEIGRPWNFNAIYMSPDGVVVGTATLAGTHDRVGWYAEVIKTNEIIVNDTRDLEDADPSDGVCDVDVNIPLNQCTLRAAIQTAEFLSGQNTISFDIEGGGVHTINLESALPAITGQIIIDATNQQDYLGKPLIQLMGNSVVGLDIQASESTVKGISIGGFSGAGIHISGEGSAKIQQNYLGVSANGTSAVPNGIGIHISGSPDNLIGGDEPEFRNVISGNTGAGILITGEDATGNVMAGNLIGTNITGTSALENGDAGVRITGSPGNTIGGDQPALRNIISGNLGGGIVVEGAESGGNTISGNYIGTDSAGSTAIPNEAGGVLIEGAPHTKIGTEVLGNVIAGNGGMGVLINGHLTKGHADGTHILNNIIGLDATGEVPLFNSGDSGIRLNGAVRQARVGQAGAGNVIAGNNKMYGVELLDLGEEVGAPDGTQVAGNHIGVTKSGASPEENLLMGVVLSVNAEDDGGGTQGVVGGEDAASGNTIRASLAGVLIEGDRSSNSVVAYNVIGNVDEVLTGEDRKGLGIWINGANQIQILSNTIGGNIFGIVLGSNESTLIFNKIGTNVAGSAARPNTIGLFIPGEIGPKNFSTGDDNIIGNEEGANVISGNQTALLIGGSFNLFRDGTGAAGTDGISPADQRQGITTTAQFRSLKTLAELPPDRPALKKSAASVSILKADENGEPDNNVIMLNKIGTNLAGDKEIGNGRATSEDEAYAAVRIESGTNNRLIGNLISGNGGGVYIGPDADFETEPANTILGANLIGGSLASATASIPNQYGGVIMFSSAGNRLTMLPIVEGGDPMGNIIRGNGKAGIQIGIFDSQDVGNQVRQSSFIDNKGPSIVLLNAEEEYPSMAPRIPEILAAAALPDDARLSFISHTTGIVDGFLSHTCKGGHGQGGYMFSLEVESGTNVVELPYHQLLSNSEDALSLYLALTITSAGAAGMTSEFSECYRIARQSDIDSTAFSINDEGQLINGAGIVVEINSNTNKQTVYSGQESSSRLDTDGILFTTRYRVKPVESPIVGTSKSADGSVVTPDMASENRYWSLRSAGIDNISYRVCLDIEELPGADMPEQLVVLHRGTASEPWNPYDSTLENEQLCAAGLTKFGDIGIGGTGVVNYLPVEPAIEDLPRMFALHTNYPNPFNPSTVIPYSLPEQTHVKLEVYDMAGRKAANLLDKPMPAGKHEMVFNAGNLASGVYIIRIEAGLFFSTQKILLMK